MREHDTWITSSADPILPAENLVVRIELPVDAIGTIQDECNTIEDRLMMVRYIGRHGTIRVSKAVLIGAVPPLMLKTGANPDGLPIEVFDGIRAGILADRSQFFKDLAVTFYRANRPGSTVSQGLRDSFWLKGMQSG